MNFNELIAALGGDMNREKFAKAIEHAGVLANKHAGDDWVMPEKHRMALVVHIYLTSVQFPQLLPSITMVSLDIAYRMGAADARLQILGNAEVRDNDNET